MLDWRPSATIEVLRQRAKLLKKIRIFFETEDVLEVETPVLSLGAGGDPYISLLTSQLHGKQVYLQSSPEFAMKRLLAAGSGSIFQVCKVFRDDELGKKHNPEFTMLEWYMLDWSWQQLMEQVKRLLFLVFGEKDVEHFEYRQLFEQHFNMNPHCASVEKLREVVAAHINVENLNDFSRDECLHVLFSGKIESAFDKNKIIFVSGFPKSQAALAKVARSDKGDDVALRFEVFHAGLELGNAYQEETNVSVLRERFASEQLIRKSQGKTMIDADEKWFAAMEAGFPNCAGIALGLDRLLMVALGCEKIKEVISFSES